VAPVRGLTTLTSVESVFQQARRSALNELEQIRYSAQDDLKHLEPAALQSSWTNAATP